MKFVMEWRSSGRWVRSDRTFRSKKAGEKYIRTTDNSRAGTVRVVPVTKTKTKVISRGVRVVKVGDQKIKLAADDGLVSVFRWEDGRWEWHGKL